MNTINCAVYCRKSSEKGLDQEFTSLDNQELACKSYILSQQFQGWNYYKTYSDAGISGATTNRPALQEMLKDIKDGKIQVVLVYKIDRLSRSIYDFKKMMKDDFERHNCTLVSITQSFDTSTAMGKLTLNMLLSFAEFEREVAAERVKDKIFATKSKGLWTGGCPPLGYDIKFKKLEVNPEEVKDVKRIFELYLESSSLLQLKSKLDELNIRNKKWITLKGKERGGTLFTKNELHQLLQNVIYIGQIQYKATKKVFKGKHQPIISKDLFDAVQEKLHRNIKNNRVRMTTYYLLRNKIIDIKTGDIFKHTNGSKGLKIYRYYRTKRISIPAGDIESITIDVVKNFLDSDMSKYLSSDKIQIFKSIKYTDELIDKIVNKILYEEGKLTFFIDIDTSKVEMFKESSYINELNKNFDYKLSDDGNYIIIEKKVSFMKLYNYSTKYYGGDGFSMLNVTENNLNLIKALSYAYKYRKMYEQGVVIRDLEKECGMTRRTIYKYLTLAYLSPKIINSIMDGEVPTHINLQTLFSLASKYQNFNEQENQFFQKN